MRESRADPQAYDPDSRAKLRALSSNLSGLPIPWPAWSDRLPSIDQELERAMTDRVFIVGGAPGLT
jgi:hypothetical protein